jgi:hypothetical protein
VAVMIAAGMRDLPLRSGAAREPAESGALAH